jgi:hypothetical protein
MKIAPTIRCPFILDLVHYLFKWILEDIPPRQVTSFSSFALGPLHSALRNSPWTEKVRIF